MLRVLPLHEKPLPSICKGLSPAPPSGVGINLSTSRWGTRGPERLGKVPAMHTGRCQRAGWLRGLCLGVTSIFAGPLALPWSLPT